MTEIPALMAAAFAAGFLGSAHCLGMCAGISGLYAAGANVAAVKSQLPLAIAYNTGRVMSYAALGLVVALIGSGAVSAIPGLAAPVRIVGGILMIVVGLQLAFNWRLLAIVEKTGARIWNHLAPHARGMLPATNVPKAFGLGLFWGWLPCGLVYSVLLLAAASAAPASGALVMIAFGLGTMPAMILSGLSAARLSAYVSRYRVGAGLVIVLLGLATVSMPLMSVTGTTGHEGHSGHSASL